MSGTSPWSAPSYRVTIGASPNRAARKDAPLTTPVRRLYRDPSNRVLAGVASGIAGHLGLSPFLVRIAFIAMLPFGGFGALLYAVFWAVLRLPPGALLA